MVICPIGLDRSPEVRQRSLDLHQQLMQHGVDVILDDRGERPGVMFADWELIGVPHRLTLGDKALKEGMIEYQHRRWAEPSRIAIDGAVQFVLEKLKSA